MGTWASAKFVNQWALRHSFVCMDKPMWCLTSTQWGRGPRIGDRAMMRGVLWSRIHLVLVPVFVLLASECGIGGSDVSISSSSVSTGTPLVLQGTLRGKDLDNVNTFAIPALGEGPAVKIEVFDATGAPADFPGDLTANAAVGSNGTFRYALDTSYFSPGQYSVQLIPSGAGWSVAFGTVSPIWHGTFTITSGE